ncbi:nitroreductase family deazaflavin-dependent oxidoreductase [Mycobacterium xenopi]|uniref:nitroreductase family deazaflavin-dependent oxidoreductase n=1 Tax=Mycobacterium xenopi TaxID=1789 RepID=UPI0022EAB7B6|nr:nitroreductase family deazaflavin-dependent oxidoreductase [Mycobacterium xenopi]MDA3662706.1 nitroreductase family deazaflavin-dependent oxidoreductase [Mycobacterium xenopi]
MANPKPPRWLKPANKLMITLQKLGIPTGPPMILALPGRKSGLPRSTPMTPFTLDGHLFAVAGYPGADWVHNARAAGVGTLSRGRKSRRVKVVELNAEESRPVLRAFPAEVPIGVGFLKRAGLVSRGTPEEVEALAGRIAVFRFDPIPAN